MQATLMERGRLWAATIDDPVPERGEVLVKSRACGICGSDLHACAHTEEFVATSQEAGGAFKLTTFDPVVLGHEFCAEVVDYGPDTHGRLKPGELVTSVPVLRRDGFLPVGYSEKIPGGFAQYMVLNLDLLVPVPAGTPAQSAAMTEPMAVGLHAVNKARLTSAETIIVLGCGPVGLAVITALQAAHKGPVIAADYSPTRRKLAAQQGAGAVVDPATTDPFVEAKANAAANADTVIFECVGVPGMIEQTFLSAPRDARIVVVGVCLQTDHSRPLIAINKELNVQYVLGYTMDEFKQTLGFIADGTFDVSQLVTAEIALSDVADMFAELANPEAQGKVVVNPWL